MQPDLGQRAANEHADIARSLLAAAEQALSGADVDAELQIRLAQAHATLALALETRAAAYDTRTAAYVAYLATLKSEARADKNQHAAVVAKLVRDRLGFEAGVGSGPGQGGFTATLWWKSLSDFERDLRSASDEKVELMRRWASDKEDSADAPGTGRAPKARRHFRQMRAAAEHELLQRGQW